MKTQMLSITFKYADAMSNCEDRADAKKQLRTYRENVNYPVRIKKWRERIGE